MLVSFQSIALNPASVTSPTGFTRVALTDQPRSLTAHIFAPNAPGRPAFIGQVNSMPNLAAMIDIATKLAAANDYGHYAQVLKDGKVVAMVENNGGIITDGATFSDAILRGGPQGVGVETAQGRAEQIAKAVGGKVALSDSAMTPEAWVQRTQPSDALQKTHATMDAQLKEAMESYRVLKVSDNSPVEAPEQIIDQSE